MLVGPEFIKPTSPESFQGPKHRGWTLLVTPRNPRDVTLGHPGSLTRVRERSPDSGPDSWVFSYRAFAAHGFSVTPRIDPPVPRGASRDANEPVPFYTAHGL